MTTEEVIKHMETTYPEMTGEFKKIMQEQYAIFCQKQMNYGPSNIAVGTTLSTPDDVRLSLTGLWFRLQDKISRLKQLIIFNTVDAVGESVEDTYKDLSVYGIIAQIVSRGKWAK